MQGIPPHYVAIAVAIMSLIVVPGVVAIAKHYWRAWQDARMAKLRELFVPREEMQMQFDALNKVQQQQHAENRDFLDTIRTEALAREGRILGALELATQQQREDQRDLRKEVGVVSGRVDSVLHMLGDRRRQ